MEALQILILIVVVATMIIKEKSKKNKQAEQTKPVQAKPIVKKDKRSKDFEDGSTPYLVTPPPLPASSIRNAQSHFEEGIPSTLDQLDTEPAEEDLSTPHMTDVKRGIIWSEILHRKY